MLLCPMTARANLLHRGVLVVWCLAVLVGCPARPTAPALPASAGGTAAPQPSAASATADPLVALADQLAARARTAEPAVTPLLERTARRLGGTLIKLEYRLKTKDSILRKIRSKLAADPATTLDAVVIDDTLRYTLQIVDEPAGHHVRAIREVIEALEAVGHQVVRLKNYWPTGDNYSGVNTVLRAADGLLWELQFHTPESVACAARTRELYEELRRTETPAARKRELFEQMTRQWDQVPVPQGMIDPGVMHPAEDIRERSCP